MRTARSVVFVIWMYATMVVMAVVCSPVVLGPRSWTKALTRFWVRLVLWGLRFFCGVTWEVRGLERLPAGGALIAFKHQSMFDTLAPWLFLNDPAYIMKKELVWAPFFGLYAMRLGNILVDRSAGASAVRAMSRAAKMRAAQGRQIAIFPEGTRVKPGESAPYKPGVVALYRGMEGPCVPVALNSGLCWPGRGLTRTPGHIVIEVLEPIAEGLERKAFLAELELRIETASNRLYQEGLEAQARRGVAAPSSQEEAAS